MRKPTNKRELPPFVFTHWEYLSPMRRHASFIVVFVLSAMLCALALTYIYSEKYEATVTLIFTPGEVTRLQNRGNDSQALGAPTPHTEFKVVGKTLENLAQSEGLLREVVGRLNLDAPEDKVYEGPWYIRYYEMFKDYAKEYGGQAWAFLKYGRIPDEDPTVEAVKTLAKDVEVVSEDSYVFKVKVLDKHPQRVAAIADTLTAELVNRANETNRAADRSRIGELEALSLQKLQQIATYQERINSLLAEYRVSSVAQEMAEGLEQLYELQAEEVRLVASIQAQERQVKTLGERIQRAEQASTQGQRANGDRLQAEDMKRIVSERLFAEVELDGLRAQQASLKKSINQIDARMKQLPQVKLEIDQLHADLSRANREYELIGIALSELQVGSSESVSELQIQHPATIPMAPVTPIKVYHVGLAGGLGVCIAIGLVYLLTFFNVRLFVPSRGIKGRRTPPGGAQREESSVPLPGESNGQDHSSPLYAGGGRGNGGTEGGRLA
jgi:uncharacterized protein involved in exopolysaccharide biosynthesis